MSDLFQKQDLRQSQNLVMTPQLQQAIKLLQLSNIELAEYVEEELGKNPLLEKDDSSPDDNGDDSEYESADGEEDVARLESGTSDFDAGGTQYGSGGDIKFEGQDQSFENRLETQKSLRQHLTDQLFIECEDSRDRMIGGLMIDHLDDTGYLRIDPDELAQILNCSRERIDHLLGIMKSFDPPGIFAADLPDCLALQLEDQNKLTPAHQKLIANLDVLADHDFKKLAKICEVEENTLTGLINDIRALNPRPASNFEHFVVQTAIPDVLMKKLPKHVGGGWRVELNTETLPRVLVNNEYYTQVAESAKKKEDREYITTQLNNANWLVRAMDQRAQTILKVASEIVEQQEAFFNYGIEFLRPLKLSDIAEEIDMHESTVSRVTTGKYIGTPRGIFELKYFFSSALGSETGGASHSSESVKARIKKLIDDEDPKKILSDDKIAEILKKDGIDIARRTVAKYREALHLGSSVQRRKQKKNAR